MGDSDKNNLNKFNNHNYYDAISFNKTIIKNSNLFIAYHNIRLFSKNSAQSNTKKQLTKKIFFLTSAECKHLSNNIK